MEQTAFKIYKRQCKGGGVSAPYSRTPSWGKGITLRPLTFPGLS